jgi:flagellar biosynthesis/type III secretory pathway M-ring protein FliF/YscJ
MPNNSFEKINDHISYLKSFNDLEQSKKVNVVANLWVVIFGLIGWFLFLFYFIKNILNVNLTNNKVI